VGHADAGTGIILIALLFRIHRAEFNQTHRTWEFNGLQLTLEVGDHSTLLLNFAVNVEALTPTAKMNNSSSTVDIKVTY